VVPAKPKGEHVVSSLKLAMPKNKAPFPASAVVNIWSYNWTGKGSVIGLSARFTPSTNVAVPRVKV